MKTRIGWLMAIACTLCNVAPAFQEAASTISAPRAYVAQPAGTTAVWVESVGGDLAPQPRVSTFAGREDQDDPSYKLYKEGYKLILDEKWEEARSTFKEMLAKYAKSKYVADANYWSAYSLKYTDKKKAIAAYKSFLKNYPSSNYFDDATADLGRLEGRDVPVVPPPTRYAPAARVSGVSPEATFEPELAATAREYAVAAQAGMTYKSPTVGYAVAAGPEDDPQTKMKLEAFQALLRSSQDDKTFDLLKQTLLDPKQSYRMKEIAIYGSKQFEKKDLVGLYLEAFRTDTSAMLRRHLLYQLGTYADGGDERVFPLLTQTALDTKLDRQTREAALIGMRNSKSHNILELYVRIAKTDTDRKFREMAIYQIGQAKPDDESAFNVLKEIVLDKNQSREIREAGLYALRAVKEGKASDFYMQVAKSDPDERIQEIALYSFTQANEGNSEKTIGTLKEIVLDKSRSWDLRQSAMTLLARVPGDEPLNFLVQVASNDPEERIRLSAINCISYLSKNKAKSRGSLMKLFRTMPSDQQNAMNSLLYAIASLGGDESVDFLETVAKTHENFEVRRAAIQYLGNIGGERARAALVEIMNGK